VPVAPAASRAKCWKHTSVEVLPKSLRQGFLIREGKSVTIILVGKLRDEELNSSLDFEREIDVINADHLLSHLRRNRPSPLFLILGRQSDWQQLVDTGNSIKNFPSLTVVFSAATEPLVSDTDIQRELQTPSVLMFALTREFTRRVNAPSPCPLRLRAPEERYCFQEYERRLEEGCPKPRYHRRGTGLLETAALTRVRLGKRVRPADPAA
jgi:hypothetical protein